jgi:hypothetical protein
MPFEERTALALEAIRPRKDVFLSAIAATTEEIRGLLAGTGASSEDQTVALGNFAAGHVDVERFAAFTRSASRVDTASEAPVRAAQEALNDLLHIGDRLFVLKLEAGANLGNEIGVRLATIGDAFAAAHLVELAKRGAYREKEHAHLLDGLAYAEWSHAERALAPGLVIELAGADFTPAQAAPYLDAGMKLVFVVEGDAPAAAMARLVTPGVFVQQAVGDASLDAFTAFEGTAAAALLPEAAVEFTHDPMAGETTYERFTTLEFPREIRKRAIGGISVAQQAEDRALLEALAVVPTPAGEAASDPAGKLSAWLLSQTNLVGEGKS